MSDGDFPEESDKQPVDIAALRVACESAMTVQDPNPLAIKELCELAIGAIKSCNNWLHEKEPWKLKGEGAPAQQVSSVRMFERVLLAYIFFSFTVAGITQNFLRGKSTIFLMNLN